MAGSISPERSHSSCASWSGWVTGAQRVAIDTGCPPLRGGSRHGAGGSGSRRPPRGGPPMAGAAAGAGFFRFFPSTGVHTLSRASRVRAKRMRLSEREAATWWAMMQ